jgi:hypothetical protein
MTTDTKFEKLTLPLVAEHEEVPKDRLLKFTLTAGGNNYVKNVRRIYSDENLRTIITSTRDVVEVWEGLGRPDGQTFNPVALTMYDGQGKTNYMLGRDNARNVRVERARKVVFDQRKEDGDDDATARTAAEAAVPDTYHIDDINAGIHYVIGAFCPTNVLSRVKHQLRRETRKPPTMRVREFWNCITNINMNELKFLPPLYNSTQQLTADELIDIALHAFPKSWRAEMERQRFDPFCNTVYSVIEFCERIESAEHMNGESTLVQRNKKGNQSKKPQKGAKGKNGGDSYCTIHGKGNHTTDECNRVKELAKKVGKSFNKPNANKSPNKTWKRKQEDAKPTNKNELKAIIRKAQKELNALDVASDSDNDSDVERHEVNALDINDMSQGDSIDALLEELDAEDNNMKID